MGALLSALRDDRDVRRLCAAWQPPGALLLCGTSDTARHAVIAAAIDSGHRQTLVVAAEPDSLLAWHDDLAALLPQLALDVLPEVDVATFSVTAQSYELIARRMNVLGRMLRGEADVVLATATALTQRVMAPDDFARLSLTLALGDHVDRERVLARLVAMGYERAVEVSRVGEFAVRGGIVDVYPVNGVEPLRLEFFDNDIDSLRAFDVDSKRSTRALDRISVLPLASTDVAADALPTAYLPSDAAVLLDEPSRLRETVALPPDELTDESVTWERILGDVGGRLLVCATLLTQAIPGVEPTAIVRVLAKDMSPYRRQYELLTGDVRDWLRGGNRVLLTLSNDTAANNLRELFVNKGLPTTAAPHPPALPAREVCLAKAMLRGGFELPHASLVVIAERDIFGHQPRRRAPVPAKNRIASFRDIKVGDYVVHSAHGIGKYLGVVTLDVGGLKRDYLHIKYAADDKLYLPPDQVQALQRYIGAEGETPRLSRMGGADWARAKSKAKAAAQDIAEELIKLYAQRKQIPGFAFPPDTPWQAEFEDAFPYELTPDQLTAVNEIKADMERPTPMDRLLCGDVGFGKTEVALRAAFKAVMGGKQVAILAPTTVLAQQHFATLTARFADTGVNVDVICRFRSAREQTATLQRVRDGRCDILIGTHALLNAKRVRFKDLGLLIVDEEQRFGVKQKERIKEIALGVDVLTLSATPIPRTLHMSLTGARDMSVIETPPAERYPIQTYVIEDDDDILAAAIRKELGRGGQVYFVYNRVETIDRMRDHLQSLVPEARIMTAHGQMSEDLLEQAMMDFYEGSFDLLLATSIVENGLDVANANTIIVYPADGFGLSQLYQMRGRVGRSHRLAFAYLVCPRNKVLSESAERRLAAMKDFAELGAGFKIALRDLEIRGAGNLLGPQQHGNIVGVGFEMYCQLLDDAVQSLRHARATSAPRPPRAEPLIEIAVEAYLDGGYISDATHKIEVYQRIAAVRSEEHLSSLLDELIDRFGEPTAPVLNLLEVARVKNRARDLGVKSLIEKGMMLELTLTAEHTVTAGGFAALRRELGAAVRVLPALGLLRIDMAAHQCDKLAYLRHILAVLAEGGAVGRQMFVPKAGLTRSAANSPPSRSNQATSLGGTQHE